MCVTWICVFVVPVLFEALTRMDSSFLDDPRDSSGSSGSDLSLDSDCGSDESVVHAVDEGKQG
jgi:hypothetical protein